MHKIFDFAQSRYNIKYNPNNGLTRRAMIDEIAAGYRYL